MLLVAAGCGPPSGSGSSSGYVPSKTASPVAYPGRLLFFDADNGNVYQLMTSSVPSLLWSDGWGYDQYLLSPSGAVAVGMDSGSMRTLGSTKVVQLPNVSTVDYPNVD
jgi:hypothetical protein